MLKCYDHPTLAILSLFINLHLNRTLRRDYPKLRDSPSVQLHQIGTTKDMQGKIDKTITAATGQFVT